MNIVTGGARIVDSDLIATARMLWRRGLNTAEIASRLRVPEAAIYNAIGLIRRAP